MGRIGGARPLTWTASPSCCLGVSVRTHLGGPSLSVSAQHCERSSAAQRLTWPLPEDLDNAMLERRRYPEPERSLRVPQEPVPSPIANASMWPRDLNPGLTLIAGPWSSSAVYPGSMANYLALSFQVPELWLGRSSTRKLKTPEPLWAGGFRGVGETGFEPVTPCL